MFKRIILFLSTILFIFCIIAASCGNKNKSIQKIDSLDSVKHDSLKNNQVTIDSFPASNYVPNPDDYKNLSSDSITNWCNIYLYGEFGDINSIGFNRLLGFIDMKIYPVELRDATKSFYFNSRINSNKYIVCVETHSTSIDDDIVLLFVFSKQKSTLIKFNYYYSESSLKPFEHAFYYNGFSRFGKYYRLDMECDNSNYMANHSMILNDDLKEVFLTRELDAYDEGYSLECSYDFSENTLIEHLIIIENQSKDLKWDVLYKCKRDTILCLEPKKLKQIEKKIEEIKELE